VNLLLPLDTGIAHNEVFDNGTLGGLNIV